MPKLSRVEGFHFEMTLSNFLLTLGKVPKTAKSCVKYYTTKQISIMCSKKEGISRYVQTS